MYGMNNIDAWTYFIDDYELGMRKEHNSIIFMNTHRLMDLINIHGLVDFIYNYVK